VLFAHPGVIVVAHPCGRHASTSRKGVTVAMQKHQAESKNIRLAEVVAALSLATDLGMGQPLEYALQF